MTPIRLLMTIDVSGHYSKFSMDFEVILTMYTIFMGLEKHYSYSQTQLSKLFKQ